MGPEAAKLIGAGLATIALAGVGIGIGNIFGSFVAGALRSAGRGYWLLGHRSDIVVSRFCTKVPQRAPF